MESVISPYKVIRLQRFLTEALRMMGSAVFTSERSVIDVVMSRTILWYKFYEKIPRSHFREPKSSCYLFCQSDNDRQNRRALASLIDGGIILKSHDLYALNVPALLNLVADYGAVEMKELKDLKALREKALVNLAAAGFHITTHLSEESKYMRDLKDVLFEAKEIGRKEAKRRSSKKTDKQTEGHSLLRFLADKIEEHHPDGDVRLAPRNTAKIRGQLSKLAADAEEVALRSWDGIGEHEEGAAIRELLDRIVKHWGYISGGTVNDHFGNQVILPSHILDPEHIVLHWAGVIDASYRAEEFSSTYAAREANQGPALGWGRLEQKEESEPPAPKMTPEEEEEARKEGIKAYFRAQYEKDLEKEKAAAEEAEREKKRKARAKIARKEFEEMLKQEGAE